MKPVLAPKIAVVEEDEGEVEEDEGADVGSSQWHTTDKTRLGGICIRSILHIEVWIIKYS